MSTASTKAEARGATRSRQRIGLCVVNWNAGDRLFECLSAALRATSRYELVLVVVDNASSDDSVKAIEDALPQVVILRNSENRGYARGCNQGAAELLAQGCGFVGFANPDIVTDEGSLDLLVRALEEHERFGCAGSLPHGGSGPHHVGRRKPTLAEKVVHYGPLRRISLFARLTQRHFLSPADIRAGVNPYALFGPLLLFRAEAFQAMGGFDESTFLYEEEFIVAERLLAAGWRVTCQCTPSFTHEEGSCTRLIPFRRRLYFIESEQYLTRTYYKWHPIVRLLLRVWRYIEWAMYSLRWLIVRSRGVPDG